MYKSLSISLTLFSLNALAVADHFAFIPTNKVTQPSDAPPRPHTPHPKEGLLDPSPKFKASAKK